MVARFEVDWPGWSTVTRAIAGALHGVEAIPADWYDGLENSPKGRDYVRKLAVRLFARHVTAWTRDT